MSIVALPVRRETVAAPLQSQPAPTALQIHTQFRLLELAGLRPIASGAERLVYQHPYDPSLLVKVIDFPAMAEHLSTRPLRRWRKNHQREGAYRNHVAELAEYTAAQNVAAGRWKVPMARVLGLAQTDMGLGLLVEKITDGKGGLAPTVEQIVREQGLGEKLARELDYFFDTLADHHIILNDVSARNVVMGENADGEPGLYLIDGFGSKQAVPVFAYSKTLNRQRILRKYQRLKTKLVLRSQARVRLNDQND
ncbi:PhoP regulatory network protein YrbL [Bordetella sputigena]|uniref:YrbL family protein n=1 Tax=Bordetella sputigena TaxID=1416810 RepID=UPI0039F12AAC